MLTKLLVSRFLQSFVSEGQVSHQAQLRPVRVWPGFCWERFLQSQLLLLRALKLAFGLRELLSNRRDLFLIGRDFLMDLSQFVRQQNEIRIGSDQSLHSSPQY